MWLVELMLVSLVIGASFGVAGFYVERWWNSK
jgi:hypothetical protein